MSYRKAETGGCHLAERRKFSGFENPENGIGINCRKMLLTGSEGLASGHCAAVFPTTAVGGARSIPILANAGIPESKLTSKPTMLEAARAAVALANGN